MSGSRHDDDRARLPTITQRPSSFVGSTSRPQPWPRDCYGSGWRVARRECGGGPWRNIQIGTGAALLSGRAFTMANLHIVAVGGRLWASRVPSSPLAWWEVCTRRSDDRNRVLRPLQILTGVSRNESSRGVPHHDGRLRVPDADFEHQVPRREELQRAAGAGLALGGIPAVLIAAFIVKSLPLTAVRWLVVAVVVYSASVMLRRHSWSGVAA